jgi:hypothetical protein
LATVNEVREVLHRDGLMPLTLVEWTFKVAVTFDCREVEFKLLPLTKFTAE